MKLTTHLGVYGVLEKDGRILLIKKSRGPYKGKLDLPGGKLEHGESVEKGLKREFIEETGVIVNSIEQINNLTTVAEFTDERGNISMFHVGLIYKVTDFDDSNLLKDMDDEDSLGAEWYTISKLRSDELSPFARDILQK